MREKPQLQHLFAILHTHEGLLFLKAKRHKNGLKMNYVIRSFEPPNKSFITM